MENGPFEDVFPIKHGDITGYSIAMLVYQRVSLRRVTLGGRLTYRDEKVDFSDFNTVPEQILTSRGRSQAEAPPDFVLGRVLTPGENQPGGVTASR